MIVITERTMKMNKTLIEAFARAFTRQRKLNEDSDWSSIMQPFKSNYDREQLKRAWEENFRKALNQMSGNYTCKVDRNNYIVYIYDNGPLNVMVKCVINEDIQIENTLLHINVDKLTGDTLDTAIENAEMLNEVLSDMVVCVSELATCINDEIDRLDESNY